MLAHRFDYAAPRRRGELLGILAERGRAARLLAGGTDLLVNIRAGLERPGLVLDLKKVEDWERLAWSEAEGLVIGPATTVNELLQDAVVRERFPLLAACAHDLASYQIRNRATVAGNVVNASPCSDMAPALLCLEATARLASKAGTRELPFSEFFAGVKKSALREDEVLERITVPASAAGARGDYRKLKRVAGHDLGIVGVALARMGGTLRVGISSCAPTPLLVAGLAEDAGPEEVLAAVRARIKPIDDLRCSAEYRAFMVETYVKRLLAEVA